MAAPRGLDSAVVDRAYAAARADRWTVARDVFTRALEASVAHARVNAAGPFDVDRYVAGLHVDDLALAAACADGCEVAWDHFVREYRPALYRAAAAIDPAGPRDLADSLYAELFGLPAEGRERRSLLRHFHGRSRLTTWLRAVLAQRHVDAIRARRRSEPLPEGDGPGTPAAPIDVDPEHARFGGLIRVVLTAALEALAPRDRLRVAMYYVQGSTLADIGRLFGEHEATVSRHLTRTRATLRAAMDDRLRREHGLDAPGVDECFRAAIDDTGSLDLTTLVASASGGKKPARDRSS